MTRRMTPDQKRSIEDYWRAGLTYKAIAQRLYITRGAVAGHCHRMNLKRNPDACAKRRAVKESDAQPVRSRLPVAGT